MNAQRIGRTLFSLMMVGGLVVVAASAADAYPGFARKYHTSCQTCHVAYPRLNDFGQAFRRNGYQFPDDPKDGYVDDVSTRSEEHTSELQSH